MSAQNESLLLEALDGYCRRMAEGLHAEGGTLKANIDARLVDETSADRRKLLTNLSARIASAWGDFCVDFHESLLRGTQVRVGLVAEDGREPVDNSALSLVDDDQMEIDIALAGVASRCLGAAGANLGEAEMRLATLYTKRAADGEAGGPFDSGVLVTALKHGFDKAIPEAEYRRGLLRWLDPILSKVIGEQIAALNVWLQEQGVDPAARQRSAGQSRPAASAQAGGNQTGGPAGGSGSGGGAGGSGGSNGGGNGGPRVAEDVLGTLQQLVQNQGSAAGGGGGGLPAGMAAFPPAMLESLNRLQSLDLSAIQSGTSLDAPPGTNVLRELRQHDAARSLPPIEAVTIDIVATLFDFIFDDPLVPDSVKALVGRLQIPLLKVAMLDKSFFSNKEHPARALLNEISRVSVAAGKNLAQDSPVFEKIKQVVNRVLDEFEKDQDIFVGLVEEMHALVVEQDTRGEEITEKTKEVAEKQEQNEIAESKAGDAFMRILDDGLASEVPAHISDFLSRKYPLVLKRALQNGGVQGAAWALAAQTLTDLLWTLTSKDSPEERQRMVAMLPDLLRRLNAFFEKVGVTPEEKSPFIDALVQQHSLVIKGQRRAGDRKLKPKATEPGETVDTMAPLNLKTAAVLAGSKTLAPTIVVTRIVQDNGIEVESMTIGGKMTNRKAVRTDEVEKIQRGDWVEFIGEDGNMMRARLSWQSPFREVMLFTNPHSSRAISVSTEALAVQLRKGQAKILGAEPMVERAISCTLDAKAA
jgi:uncharacterized membrane protein YgcG